MHAGRANRKLIEECKQPPEGSKPLHFDSQFAVGYLRQFQLLLKCNADKYWRMPEYNAIRFFFTIVFSLTLGSIYWRIGKERSSAEGISNLAGALLVANIFLGTSNASTVQPVAAHSNATLLNVQKHRQTQMMPLKRRILTGARSGRMSGTRSKQKHCPTLPVGHHYNSIMQEQVAFAIQLSKFRSPAKEMLRGSSLTRFKTEPLHHALELWWATVFQKHETMMQDEW